MTVEAAMKVAARIGNLVITHILPVLFPFALFLLLLRLRSE
jgi:hypothetical protein